LKSIRYNLGLFRNGTKLKREKTCRQRRASEMKVDLAKVKPSMVA
jgi:hypothetical protein